jgi:hypothetical protein
MFYYLKRASRLSFVRFYGILSFYLTSVADKIIKTPSMGESISEGTLTQWHKSKLSITDVRNW